MRLAVLGVGAVGRSVAELAGEYGHDVTALADSGGAVVAADEGLGAIGLQLAVLGGLCVVLVAAALLLWQRRCRTGVAS